MDDFMTDETCEEFYDDSTYYDYNDFIKFGQADEDYEP